MASRDRSRGLAAGVALVLMVAAVGLLFLPYQASSDPGLVTDPEADFPGITIECGNFFGGISGGPERPEIVEGSEEASSLPIDQLLGELIEAADACTSGGLVRVAISGVLLLTALVLILLARRSRASAVEDSVGEPGEGANGE